MKTIKELRRKVCKKEYDKLRYLKIIKVDRKVNNLQKKIYQKKYRNLNKDKINDKNNNYRNLNKDKINEYRNLNKEKNRNRIKKKKSLSLEWDFLNPCEK